MNTGSAPDMRADLIEILGDKQRRLRLAAEFRKRRLAEQLREMRLARGWRQSDVAEATGKVQETISQLENPDYGRYTIRTLERLADAFDVPLFVYFGTWSELVDRIVNLSPKDMEVPDFEHDPGLVSSTNYFQTKVTAEVTPPMRADKTERYLRLLPPPAPPESFLWAANTADEMNETPELTASAAD